MKKHEYITIIFIFCLLVSLTALGKVQPEVEVKLKLLENITGCEFIITSGRRSKTHNKAVGGAKNSYHLTGQALDIVPKKSCNLSISQIGKIATKVYNGVIVYPRHVHLDVRPVKYYSRGVYK